MMQQSSMKTICNPFFHKDACLDGMLICTACIFAAIMEVPCIASCAIVIPVGFDAGTYAIHSLQAKWCIKCSMELGARYA